MLDQFFVSDVITSLDGGDCKTLVVARFLFCGEVKCYLFIGLTTNSVKGLVTFSSDFRVSQYFGLPIDGPASNIQTFDFGLISYSYTLDK